MYSISSLFYIPENSSPLQSSLKPAGKGQAIVLTMEIIAGAAICGFGLYILLTHGAALSVIGVLGSEISYTCLIAPGALVLSDYLIGSAIKGVKNHNALKLEKIPEDEGDSSEEPPHTDPIDPISKRDNNELEKQEEIRQEEVKSDEELNASINLLIEKQKEELTEQKAQLTLKLKQITYSINIIKTDTSPTEWLQDYEGRLQKAQQELELFKDPVHQENCFKKSNMSSALNADPKRFEEAKASYVKEFIREKQGIVETMQNKIKAQKQKIEESQEQLKQLKIEQANIQKQIEGIDEKLKSWDQSSSKK